MGQNGSSSSSGSYDRLVTDGDKKNEGYRYKPNAWKKDAVDKQYEPSAWKEYSEKFSTNTFSAPGNRGYERFK